MRKEQQQPICEYFDKDKSTEDTRCGFAKYLKTKPTELVQVPEVGCGKQDISKCHRYSLASRDPNNINKFPFNEFSPATSGEFNIAFPVIRVNDKGEKKRLPGGTFR